ncbi:tripartite tricarboxylate transporter TctB family protein [Compostimonas suwonensis]|uniref:Tripartite tricarboxylate transporter TctB family protein n=1 Tax=Compostimonas suwonensis TaxID=1048394 RepID=A0A2M9C077_9MICO|nr:tripartite tricarboxylate transporter TctB family protein [Compostimonas suwonensis]PJJ63741.1 tripartite tricarboxylate transporter TctB family protein [Compostimonas suwonensis]
MTPDPDPRGAPEAPDDPLADLFEEEPEVGHRVSERISVTVTGCLFLALSAIYLVQAFGYDVGTLDQPGAGLFPIIIGCGMVAASIGLIGESIRLPREQFVVWPLASYAFRLVVVLLASIVYIAAIPTIGQFLAGFVLCVAMLFAMRSKRWWLTVLLSIVFSAGVEFLFGTVLSVPLPAGPLF